MPDFTLPNFLGEGTQFWHNFLFSNPQGTTPPPPNQSPARVPGSPSVPYGPNIDPGIFRVPKQNDVVSAAMQSVPQNNGSSYFPAVNQRLYAGNDRTDLLNDIEGTFYGGGNANPTPTPTPTPSSVKPTQMTLAQLMDHFGVTA